MPFGIWLQAARNAAEQVGANLRHLAPGGLAAFEFRSVVGRAGIERILQPRLNEAEAAAFRASAAAVKSQIEAARIS